MRRFSAFIFAGVFLISLCGCGGGGNGIGAVTVQFTTTPGTVPGGANFVFSVTTQNDTQNRGVNFSLALNTPSNGSTTTPCTAACGALSGPSNVATANGPDTFTSTTTVTYSAPLLPPTPNSLILTATSVTNASVTTTSTFTIGAPEITVRILNKITNIQPGAAPVTLNAQVQFDTANAGVTWTLTAQGAACSPACGTLSNPQPLSVVYTPPASLPAAPNNTRTITATSVTDTTRSDFDDLRIQAPTQPISVSITNPFAQINAGSPGVTINANVTNDVAGQGVIWSLEPSSQTGALSAEQPLSVIYTPPNTAPQPPNNTPTITATSVADPSKSDSFSFTIEPAQAAFQGAYAFLIRGHDDSGNTIVAAGSLTADGVGNITNGEMDASTNNIAGPESISPITGTYDHHLIPHEAVHVTLHNVALPAEITDLSFDVIFDAHTASNAPPSLASGFSPAASISSVSVLAFSLGDIRGQSGRWNFRGEIERQDLDAANLANFTGRALAFHLHPGDSAAAREMEFGEFTLGPNGAILTSTASSNGSVPVGVPEKTTSGILSAFDANGRATLTITFQNEPTRQYAAYATSAGGVYFSSIDTKLTSWGGAR